MTQSTSADPREVSRDDQGRSPICKEAVRITELEEREDRTLRMITEIIARIAILSTHDLDTVEIGLAMSRLQRSKDLHWLMDPKRTKGWTRPW